MRRGEGLDDQIQVPREPEADAVARPFQVLDVRHALQGPSPPGSASSTEIVRRALPSSSLILSTAISRPPRTIPTRFAYPLHLSQPVGDPALRHPRRGLRQPGVLRRRGERDGARVPASHSLQRRRDAAGHAEGPRAVRGAHAPPARALRGNLTRGRAGALDRRPDRAARERGLGNDQPGELSPARYAAWRPPVTRCCSSTRAGCARPRWSARGTTAGACSRACRAYSAARGRSLRTWRCSRRSRCPRAGPSRCARSGSGATRARSARPRAPAASRGPWRGRCCRTSSPRRARSSRACSCITRWTTTRRTPASTRRGCARVSHRCCAPPISSSRRARAWRSACARERSDVELLANVADVDLFSGAVTGAHPEPARLAGLRRPRAVYVGNLAAYRFDFAAVRALARALPELEVVLIGPVGLGDPKSPQGPAGRARGGAERALPRCLAAGRAARASSRIVTSLSCLF